jgi:hypothetical protein
MHSFRTTTISLVATIVLSVHANGQTTTTTTTDPTSKTNPATSVGVSITLPPLYEATIQGVSALATSGAAALKTYRSDARAGAIRAALSKALFAASGAPTTITLDKANKDPALAEITILCGSREDYASEDVYRNYLNTLIQNIDAVSKKASADSTIIDALKLLLASSSYHITDGVKVDPQTVADIRAKATAACEADLKAYAKDYYGADMPVATQTASAASAAAPAGLGIDFSFLGPGGRSTSFD